MYDKSNIFNKILEKQLPADIVFENEFSFCFKDINPVARIHLLVIPKVEAIDYFDFLLKTNKNTAWGFFNSINEIVTQEKIESFRLITNKGAEMEQRVFHFHVHIIAN